MIKKLFLLFILIALLSNTAMAMQKDMTQSNIRLARPGDIVLVPYTDVAGVCDFSQQIVKMPQTASSNTPSYECVYIGGYRKQ